MEQHTMFFFLIYRKYLHRDFEQLKKAVADPIAILIDIISSKFVETKKVKMIPTKKPIRTI